jgi:U3 small nucleolar RNA-associated protein 12
MPVSCFDISTDNTLLVSASADKNVKIWGMDFGDCHKSFLAHNDIVTCVKFVPQTHFFFSCSKDKTIKYYDADVFNLIMEFTDNAFYDSIWWLDINKEGSMLIAVSADYSIKVYEITEEQIIPEFAYEEKLDKLITDEAEKDLDKKDAIINPLNKDIDQLIPLKKRMDNIGYAEDLMDTIILCDKYKEEVYQYEIALDEFEKSKQVLSTGKKKDIEKLKVYNLEIPDKPVAPPLMLNMGLFEYMLYKIKSIRSSELESTLNNLPYVYFQSLMFYFEYYIRNNIEVELIGRCVVFFAFAYQKQISNDKTILRYMLSIQEHLSARMKLNEDLVNFNIKSIELILRNNEIIRFQRQSAPKIKRNSVQNIKSETV